MDQRRLILFLVLSFSILMLWEGWQKQHQPVPAPAANAPQATSAADGAVPTPSSSAAAVPPTADAQAAVSNAPRVTVRTDMLVAEVSAEGGSIVHLELTKHKSRDDVSRNFVLFDDGAEHLYAAQSGLIGDGLPTHRTSFALPAGEQVLKDGQDTLTVRLEAPEQNGVKVAKLLTFHRGSYVVDVAWEITNGSGAPIAPHAYYQFTRDGKPSEPARRFGVNAFTGPAFYTEAEKYQKVKFDEIENGKAKFAKKASDGWMAMVQHYFVGAWLPQGNVEREFFARKVGNDLYSSGMILPVEAIAPGQSGKVSAELYAGPQEQDKLASVAKGLDLVVDYGWLTVIAAPLFWVLSWIHSVVGNWGWSIILVTVAIKALFFPLSAASYKSMAKMRVLGPRMQRLKQLYGDDKVKLQQEMMEMYKREKINPLGGCLPILVQIPVFISLYWVLLGSVEMRHAPWLGWIQDLSAQDPYYILPVLMGISMFVQTKLNPTPPDPIQAKVMLIMPLVFSVMFLWFPSGLVLYWVVNNVLSITQQWKITRMIEGGKSAAKPA
ncbi:MAG TPA: membrane protein insertase YidC [Aromatoleum sp.]|uniref:membrane protein insertase YidC n=1 Tax=Aromatoleum sp. TaxID=2307007 RepID=UPI002B4A9FD2|nr:membrane protein insertase YidC [Aromatoleum sp.]HJV28363.1 membrane protein insertase YidC [Aromatoleum sp.]